MKNTFLLLSQFAWCSIGAGLYSIWSNPLDFITRVLITSIWLLAGGVISFKSLNFEDTE
jgi:hypothetical protein